MTIKPTAMALQLKDGFKGSRMIVLPTAVQKEMEQGDITSLLHVTDIGYFPHAQYHFRQRSEGVTQYILIYCTDGKGWISCGATKHILSSGTYFIIPPGIPHTYGADDLDPWSIYWIHFTGTLAHTFGDGHDQVREINFSEDSRISNRLELFEEVYRSLEAGYSKAQLDYSSSALFHLLGTFIYIDAFRGNDLEEESGYSIISRCRHFMMENLERKLSLNDICGYLGFSTSYCNALFNKFTGMSPGQYLQNLRIQTAAHLMEISNMKINQICHKVGIGDPYYFSRLFSKTLGVSPSEYRKRNK